jgi:hypothetical protein
MEWNTGAIVIATQSNTNTNTDFDGNFSVNAKVEILKISMLGFDPITANATLDLMTITMMESGYSIERGCDHWVRSRKRLIILLQLFL